MSRQISLLTAATTSAVILAFLIPLGLLVRSLAADRATADADTEARNIAILVSSLHEDPGLASGIEMVDARSPARTTVVLAEGTRLGSGDVAPTDPDVVRGREGTAFTSASDQGRRTVVPVLTANGTDVVVTDVSEAQLRQGVARAWAVLGALGLVMTSFALLVAGRMGHRISTPLTRVAETADAMREGDLSARAVVEGPAETQALAVSLNRLGDRITELLGTERAVVGELAHRLRTPVTALRIDVERLRDEDLSARLGHHVANLQRTVDAIVKDARRPVRHAIDAGCDAAEVVRERVEFWSVLAEDQGRELEVDVTPSPLVVPLDRSDLDDLVDILIDNVFAHTGEGIGFAVRLSQRNGLVDLVVTDLGGPALTRPAESQGRSGLGLQIARRTLAAAGGSLDVVTTPRGTTVTVRMPLSGAPRVG